MANPSLTSTARKRLLRRGRALLRRSEGITEDLEALSDADREELGEIHAALERIERGIYGRCCTCSGAIEQEQLEQVPWQRHCTGCLGPGGLEVGALG